MDLAHAHSLIPPNITPHIEPHRPDRDAAALHRLALWSLRIAPIVSVDSPDGLLIDAGGTERLHKGEDRLIRSAARALHRLGFNTRIAAASTFACAWGLARYGRDHWTQVSAGQERAALAPLPIAALHIDDTLIHTLSEIGIATIADLLKLPRAAIASRFPAILLERLDQALGQAIEHIESVRMPPPLRSSLMFDGPTDHWESVESAAREVLKDLVRQLHQQQRGIRRLDLEILRPQHPADCIEISLSRPSCSLKHLWSLLHSRLEQVDLGKAVDGLAMTAAKTARLRHQQGASASLGADGDHIAAAAWGELLDTLAGRLGSENVLQMQLVESHLPERAVRLRSVLDIEPDSRSKIPNPKSKIATRPTVLFSRPEPAEVMALSPDGPLISIAWRGHRWLVMSCTGPERIAPEWWRWPGHSQVSRCQGVEVSRDSESKIQNPKSRIEPSDIPHDRDYFTAQIETGRWLWVCRQVGAGRWYVHGEWS